MRAVRRGALAPCTICAGGFAPSASRSGAPDTGLAVAAHDNPFADRWATTRV
jgi:hypothetical protein